MSDANTPQTPNKTTIENAKTKVVQLLILVLVLVITALVTYSITSKQYLDQLDEQNKQIHSLQNALRRSNGLPEQEN